MVFFVDRLRCKISEGEEISEQDILQKLDILLSNYTTENVKDYLEDITQGIKKLWIKSNDRRTNGLVKEEQKKNLDYAGVSLNVLKSMGKTIGRNAKGREADFLPLATGLWNNQIREGRIIAAYMLGEIVLVLPEQVFKLSRKLAGCIVSWEEADNMIMSIEPAVRKDPDLYFPWLDDWFTDSCKWIRRIAITIAGRLTMKKHEYTDTCQLKPDCISS